MNITEIQKKKNYILVHMSPAEHELDLELNMESAMRIAHDVRRLNGGKAVTMKLGDEATLTLNGFDQVLNSDIVEGEME